MKTRTHFYCYQWLSSSLRRRRSILLIGLSCFEPCLFNIEQVVVESASKMLLRALNSLLLFSSVSEWCIKFPHFLPHTSPPPPPPTHPPPPPTWLSSLQACVWCSFSALSPKWGEHFCTLSHHCPTCTAAVCVCVCTRVCTRARAHVQKSTSKEQLDFSHQRLFCTEITAVTLDCPVVGWKIEVLHKASVPTVFLVSLCTDGAPFLPWTGAKQRHSTAAKGFYWLYVHSTGGDSDSACQQFLRVLLQNV